MAPTQLMILLKCAWQRRIYEPWLCSFSKEIKYIYILPFITLADIVNCTYMIRLSIPLWCRQSHLVVLKIVAFVYTGWKKKYWQISSFQYMVKLTKIIFHILFLCDDICISGCPGPHHAQQSIGKHTSVKTKCKCRRSWWKKMCFYLTSTQIRLVYPCFDRSILPS